MTDEQFEQLLTHLKDIHTSIESLKGSPDSKNKYDLSDVCSELSSITTAVDSVESAVDKLSK